MKIIFGAAVLAIPCLALGATGTPGLYYFGAEVETFHPCKSRQELWVLGTQSDLKPLRERIQKIREAQKTPYPAIYVELVGRIGPKDTSGGFAESYDGVFHLEQVLKISETVPKGCRT